MFRLIKQVFIGLLSFSGSLTSMVHGSNFTTCISLNYQPCMARPIFIDLIAINIIKDCITIHILLS